MGDSSHRQHIGMSIVLVLFIAGTSFFIGYKFATTDPSVGKKGIVLSCDPTTLAALTIPKSNPASSAQVVMPNRAVTAGTFYGSKNGTKYYRQHCVSTQKRIKPENIIWFSSSSDAEIQGYTPSNSC